MTGPFLLVKFLVSGSNRNQDSSESELKTDHWLNVMAPTTDGNRLPKAVRE